MANDFGLKPTPTPATPKHPGSWPAWYYGPNDGEKAVFSGQDEVPDGWATSRYNAKQLARERTNSKPPERMEREAIIAELKARGIKYDFRRNTGELWQLLRDLREHEGPLEATAVVPSAPGGDPAATADDDQGTDDEPGDGDE